MGLQKKPNGLRPSVARETWLNMMCHFINQLNSYFQAKWGFKNTYNALVCSKMTTKCVYKNNEVNWRSLWPDRPSLPPFSHNSDQFPFLEGTISSMVLPVPNNFVSVSFQSNFLFSFFWKVNWGISRYICSDFWGIAKLGCGGWTFWWRKSHLLIPQTLLKTSESTKCRNKYGCKLWWWQNF